VVSAGLVLFEAEPHPLSIAGIFGAVVVAGAGADSGAFQTSEDPHGSILPEGVTALTGAGGLLADRLKAELMAGAVEVLDGMAIDVKAEGAGGLVGDGSEKSNRSADMLWAGFDCTGGDGEEKKSPKPPEGFDTCDGVALGAASKKLPPVPIAGAACLVAGLE
jgi:hypothetical protein